jgi:hypothetical protein
VHDHPVPVGTTVNGQYYCALLQDRVRLAVRHEQPELPEHGVILLQDSSAPQHHDVRNLLQHRGWDVLAHAPYCPDLAQCDYWLFARVKEHLRGKRFELDDDIITPVTTSLQCLSKDEYRAAIYHLPHR